MQIDKLSLPAQFRLKQMIGLGAIKVLDGVYYFASYDDPYGESPKSTEEVVEYVTWNCAALHYTRTFTDPVKYKVSFTYECGDVIKHEDVSLQSIVKMRKLHPTKRTRFTSVNIYPKPVDSDTKDDVDMVLTMSVHPLHNFVVTYNAD